MVSTISVPGLSVCDLANTATRGELAVDLAALTSPDLTIPQEWGLAIQKHSDAVSGIKFRSRFSNRACLAIFDRGGIQAQLQDQPLAELSSCDPALDWLTRHDVTIL